MGDIIRLPPACSRGKAPHRIRRYGASRIFRERIALGMKPGEACPPNGNHPACSVCWEWWETDPRAVNPRAST